MTHDLYAHINREFLALGTVNGIYIYGHSWTEALDAAQRRVVELENRLSVFRPGSEIWRINKNAGMRPVTVSPETFRLLAAAKEYGSLSGGAVSITARPLSALWNVGQPGAAIPEPNMIEAAQALVNDGDLVLEEDTCTAFLARPGQSVDLGGIAKGYAADEVRRVLIQYDVECAVIDLGGNIVTIGTRPDGSPWRIGIQNPADIRGNFICTVSVHDETVVTSGINERFFVKNGVICHHIIDPRSGRPAQSGLMSVTVVGQSSIKADALSTAVFVLGIHKGAELLKNQNAQAVFASDDYKIYTTGGMAHRFSLNREPQSKDGGAK